MNISKLLSKKIEDIPVKNFIKMPNSRYKIVSTTSSITFIMDIITNKIHPLKCISHYYKNSLNKQEKASCIKTCSYFGLDNKFSVMNNKDTQKCIECHKELLKKNLKYIDNVK